jgi:hypothetical protein
MLQRHTSFTARRIIKNSHCHQCFRSQQRAYSLSLVTPITNLTRPRTSSRDWRPLYPTSHQIIHIRGAKKQATVSLDDLPQGPIGSANANIDPQDDEPGYPPLLQQVRNNMLKFSHCVLLTRVGGFYEVSLSISFECYPNYQTAVFRARRRVCSAVEYQEDEEEAYKRQQEATSLNGACKSVF